MTRAQAAWCATLGGAVAAEFWALARNPDCTLSRAVRGVCRVETPAGRAAFLLGWGALAVWFPRHVIGGPRCPSHR